MSENKTEREAFEAWAEAILGGNPTWRESGDCELAWQAWQARAAIPQAVSAEPSGRYECEGGPIRDGWQISIGPGHSGYGIYAHMTEYPDEGAICLAVFDPNEYPDASVPAKEQP